MGNIGPFRPNMIARINWELILNGIPFELSDPRVQTIVQPNGTELPNYPRPMFRFKKGTYMLETSFSELGNYTVILQGELEGATIEDIAEFIVEMPSGSGGYPRIEISCPSS